MPETQVLTERFTRRDYMQLPEGFPAELIEGNFVREPSPVPWHQTLLNTINKRLLALLGPDRVLPAPTDVYVDDCTVLQPDLLVRWPEDAVHEGTPPGAIPLLVVEVLSPTTARRDRDVKTAIYLRAGVREVWLVDPSARRVEVHTTGGVERHAGASRAVSVALPGFTLAWSDLATRPGSP
jgi:Uma2 family endonuclease